MKTRLINLLCCLLCGSAAISMASDKRTADFYLTSPFTYEGQIVTVDVAFVKPIHWTSPFPGVAFFHTMTVNRGEYKPGGRILVAVPADKAVDFAKKYGTNFERADFNSLKGTFLAAGGGGPERGGKVWLIDTTGQLAKLIAERKLEFPRQVLDEPLVAEGGFGAGAGGGRRPGRH
jgi:hypothetical protein